MGSNEKTLSRGACSALVLAVVDNAAARQIELLQSDRTLQRSQHVIDHVGLNHFLTYLGQLIQGRDVRHACASGCRIAEP